jgi:tRNA threonylcarbamoyl adenosine modification protein YjeE
MPVLHPLPDLAATAALARALAASMAVEDVLLLDGPLGAGKTTLVRSFVEALGGDPALVSSPTYTLLHRYDGRVRVVHVDAYRLEDAAGLAALGFDELMEGAIGVVEWAARVPDAFAGRGCWRVALAHAEGGARVAQLGFPAGKRLQDPPVTRMLP